MHFAMDHIVLNVEDVAGMIKFYTEVLDLMPERLDSYYQGKAPFPSVRINSDTIIDIFPPEMWQRKDREKKQGKAQDSRLNHFCLTVKKEEWTSFLERINDHGVSIIEGPTERWGAHGRGISVYFHDPEKNIIEVRHYPNGTIEETDKLVS